eukprot:757046-Hanusia_phi.AAC.5
MPSRCLTSHLQDGDVRFLIATDVAARGIDISGLPYVVNMTLPGEAEGKMLAGEMLQCPDGVMELARMVRVGAAARRTVVVVVFN